MSCMLEFISIKLDDIKDLFASGNDAIRDDIIAEGNKIYNKDPNDEETQEARFLWGEIAHSLCGGKLGEYLSKQIPLGTINDKNDLISEMKALSITTAIRLIGHSIAGVSHSNRAGDIFRTEPFTYLNQSGFLGNINSFLILNRPLFNQIHLSFPGCGGLTKSELASIQMDKLSLARPSSGDTDVDAWVCGILNLIEEVKLHDLDLVTIYE